MAEDKKNIPDAGKADEPTKPGKVEPAKAVPPGAGSACPGQGGVPRDRRCAQGGSVPHGGATGSGG